MKEYSELTKRQAQIAGAAIEIIGEVGIQGLTIKTLAAKIGVTEGAIYRHFTSKWDILGAIAAMFNAGSTDILKRVIASELSGLEKIKRFFLGRLEQFMENRGLVLVMFSDDIFKGNSDLQKQVHGTMGKHKELVLEAVREGREKGQIRGGIAEEHLFMIIMGALRLLVTQWKLSGFSFDLNAKGAKLWASIESLLAPDTK